MVYDPESDSFLLRDSLPEVLSGLRVLDVGCGSGILSVEAAKRGGKVVALDIDKEAVLATKRLASEKGVSVDVRESDLFEKVADEKFDLIICNPPYLPNDDSDKDLALDGGVEGWEFIARFLSQVKDHLEKEGGIYLLYSSRTDPEKVNILMEQYGFSHKVINKKHVGFFEKLFVEILW